jgi:hypothetical protein
MTSNEGRHGRAIKRSGSKGEKNEGGRRDLSKSREKRRESGVVIILRSKSLLLHKAFWRVIYIFENLDQRSEIIETYRIVLG